VRSAQPLKLASGQLIGWGTVAAEVTNHAATVAPSDSNGPLTIHGRFTQELGGYLRFALPGGSAGVNHSKLNISGAAKLSGSIGVQFADDYAPDPGTEFEVMTFASHTGDFAGFDGFFLLGQERRLIPQYSRTSLRLVTVSAPEPVGVPFRVTVENGAALVTWPSEFEGYNLYYTTGLNPVIWTLLPGIANRYLEPPPLPPEKYFLLSKP
jgi:hypothetical protein